MKGMKKGFSRVSNTAIGRAAGVHRVGLPESACQRCLARGNGIARFHGQGLESHVLWNSSCSSCPSW